MLAGLSRTFIEFFRPDQARIGDTFISYTMTVSFAMAVVGVILLLTRFGKLKLAMLEGWEDKYQVTKVESKPAKPRARVKPYAEDVSDMDEAEVMVSVPAKRKTVATATTASKNGPKKASATSSAREQESPAEQQKSSKHKRRNEH